MPDPHSQTHVPTSSLVARSVDCHGDRDGLCKLLKQSFELPVGFCLLTGPTVLESASSQRSQCGVGMLGYQCLLEAYQLQPATVMPLVQVLEPANGAAARPALPSQTMEACLTCFGKSNDGGTRSRGYIFTFFTKKNSLPPRKYHCKSILRQPRS